ncbi:Ribosomal L1 domain-containing protein [Arachis hypogaea]|nr:Ribosomal L1 domain-containing protein [Arachis hypogaea]
MASAASPRIPTETVKNAVEALLKWRDSNSESHKPKLFDADEEFVYLVVTLKTIPHKSRVNPYKVPLPHSLLSPFNETCLIIDDRSKSKPTKQEAQKKIKADNVAVSKVLRLSKLASDYRPFEAKRKLCDSYDLFFADKRVVPLMPRLLGKKFFKKKKVPVQVDLTKKNWKEQVDKACSSALLFLGTGTCCVVKVAKKWANVRSLHVKLYESLALPVFQAVPEVKLRIEGSKVEEAEKEKQKMEEEEEGEDHSGAKAVKKKKKGRIHEVRYMDSEVGEDNVEDVAGSEDDGGGVVMEEDLKDAGKGSGELANKKRKKGALSELSSVKELKKSVKRSGKQDKSAKVMKENSIKKSQNSELSVEDGDSGKKGKNIKKKLSQLQSEEADLKKKVRAKKSKKAA